MEKRFRSGLKSRFWAKIGLVWPQFAFETRNFDEYMCKSDRLLGGTDFQFSKKVKPRKFFRRSRNLDSGFAKAGYCLEEFNFEIRFFVPD